MDPVEKIIWHQKHNNPDLMRKEVGNALWQYRHTLAEWTKPDPVSQEKAFTSLVADVEAFPCDKCASGGMKWVASHPFDPESDSIKVYTWELHNAVNQHVENKIQPIEILKIYEPMDCLSHAKLDELMPFADTLFTQARLKAIQACPV